MVIIAALKFTGKDMLHSEQAPGSLEGQAEIPWCNSSHGVAHNQV
jgi:hypothetical protein